MPNKVRAEICQQLTNITTRIKNPPTWAKISAVALCILLTLTFSLTAIVGTLALAGGHIWFFAPLNAFITSIWKGLPYLMTAMGGPALLNVLGLIVFGVYIALKISKKNQLVSNAPELSKQQSAPLFKEKYISPSNQTRLELYKNTHSGVVQEVYVIYHYDFKIVSEIVAKNLPMNPSKAFIFINDNPLATFPDNQPIPVNALLVAYSDGYGVLFEMTLPGERSEKPLFKQAQEDPNIIFETNLMALQPADPSL